MDHIQYLRRKMQRATGRIETAGVENLNTCISIQKNMTAAQVSYRPDPRPLYAKWRRIAYMGPQEDAEKLATGIYFKFCGVEKRQDGFESAYLLKVTGMHTECATFPFPENFDIADAYRLTKEKAITFSLPTFFGIHLQEDQLLLQETS